jgi:hypothetical protein
MNQVLINKYLTELAKLRQVGGTHRESAVREAFKDLLKIWGRSLDLTFILEYELDTKTKERRYVDSTLLHTLRVPFGYWEAKDEKDDLDAEIDFKLRRGYPKANLVFEDSTQAVLIRLDSETTLAGMPPEAWDYRLGNRSALEWVLDQYKEKTPKDPTILEKFNTCRFADYKDNVIDLLARVTTVSVETMNAVAAMKQAAR